MRLTCTIILLLLITSLVLPAQGKKRSRWNFDGDEDDDNDNRGNRRGRHGRGHRRNKSLLGSLFLGDTDGSSEDDDTSTEVVDLDVAAAIKPVTDDDHDAVDDFLDEVASSSSDLSDHEELEVVESKPESAQQQEHASTVTRPSKNPCQDFACEEGEECKFGEDFQPYCQCRKKCYDPTPTEEVCSSFNETFPSRCHLFREKCYCKQDSIKCKNRKNKQVHLEYNAACKELPVCEEGQLEDFPRRMREWLFNVMKDFAERQYLRAQYLELEKEAEKMEKSWVNAVIWKFCDLDIDPEDRYIDRHELIRLKAPVIPMEQCIIPFLDHCDLDKNHRITLKEWGHCLTLDEEEILDRCVESKP